MKNVLICLKQLEFYHTFLQKSRGRTVDLFRKSMDHTRDGVECGTERFLRSIHTISGVIQIQFTKTE